MHLIWIHLGPQFLPRDLSKTSVVGITHYLMCYRIRRVHNRIWTSQKDCHSAEAAAVQIPGSRLVCESSPCERAETATSHRSDDVVTIGVSDDPGEQQLSSNSNYHCHQQQALARPICCCYTSQQARVNHFKAKAKRSRSEEKMQINGHGCGTSNTPIMSTFHCHLSH
jgi:hypothetical protein